jgi:hypothetical protein
MATSWWNATAFDAWQARINIWYFRNQGIKAQ